MNWKQRIEKRLEQDFPGGNVSARWEGDDPIFSIEDSRVNTVEEVCQYADTLWKEYGGELRIDPQDAYEVA